MVDGAFEEYLDPIDIKIMDRYYRSQRWRRRVCRVIGHKWRTEDTPSGYLTSCDRCWMAD